MPNKIQLRRDTAAVWASVNPTLSDGEVGLETDTRYAKFGDGATPWNALGYIAAGPPVAGGGAIPANTVLPAITGTAQDGQTLTCSNGTWTNAPTSYTRQWKRAGAAIAGATGPTYLLALADVGSAITCTVVASNAAGASAGATSAATGAVAAAGPDTRPRFGYGAATAGVATPAALLASMAALSGSSNGGLVGTFVAAPGSGQYTWAAFLASASAGGVTFTDSLGTGGWQGASSPGDNGADDGSSPNTSAVTYDDGTTIWRLFRQSYVDAPGSFSTA